VLPDTLINKAIAMYAKIEGIELCKSTGELDDIQPKHMEKLIAQYEKFRYYVAFAQDFHSKIR